MKPPWMPLLLLTSLVVFSCARELKDASITVTIDGDTFDLNAAEFSFGLVPSGLELEPSEVRVTNLGSTQLSISSILIQALSSREDAESFELTNTTLPAIESGASQDFNLNFEPTASGGKNASMVIQSNAADRPTLNVTVTGHTEWGSAFLDPGSVGLNQDANANAERPVFIRFDGKLYAAWEEENGASQIRVSVFNGNFDSPSWSLVDGGGSTGLNKNTASDARNPRFASNEGKLYLAWDEEVSGQSTQIRVAVYNSSDSSPSWSRVDGDGANGLNKATQEDASHPTLASLNSKLYLLWSEEADAGRQVRAAVYNGNDSSPNWSFVDGNGATGINKDVNQDALRPTAYIFSGKLYATWYERASSTNHIRVSVYNSDDSAPSWTSVDGNLARRRESTQAARPQLLEFNDVLFLTWNERISSPDRIRVALYNGNDESPNWTLLDSGSGIAKTTSEKATCPQLLNFRRKLYVVWNESRGEQSDIRIALYNNNASSPAFHFVDGDGTTGINKSNSGIARDPQMVGFNGRILGIWRESDGGAAQIRVGIANK